MGALLPGIAIGSTVAGALFQKRATRQDAAAIKDAAEFNARQALQAGAEEEARRRRLARRTLSSQRVAFAKAGVVLEGSPLELLAQNAAELERDAVNEGIAARQTAALERFRGESAEEVARRRGGASLLSGLTRAASLGASLTLVGRR
jgi:hypothetical protein